MREFFPMVQIVRWGWPAFLILIGCGVKGDPLPPERPPELGRGKPSYIRATEGIIYPELPPINREKENSNDDEEENENR